ncbi:hypothetical protein [Microvirga sp. P5_D2]
MTLLNLFSSRARVGSGDAPSDDRSILLMVVLLLGLVFAPVIGLHIAAVALGAPAAASSPDSLAHHATPPKPTRG